MVPSADLTVVVRTRVRYCACFERLGDSSTAVGPNDGGQSLRERTGHSRRAPKDAHADEWPGEACSAGFAHRIDGEKRGVGEGIRTLNHVGRPDGIRDWCGRVEPGKVGRGVGVERVDRSEEGRGLFNASCAGEAYSIPTDPQALALEGGTASRTHCPHKRDPRRGLHEPHDIVDVHHRGVSGVVERP